MDCPKCLKEIDHIEALGYGQCHNTWRLTSRLHPILLNRKLDEGVRTEADWELKSSEPYTNEDTIMRYICPECGEDIQFSQVLEFLNLEKGDIPEPEMERRKIIKKDLNKFQEKSGLTNQDQQDALNRGY